MHADGSIATDKGILILRSLKNSWQLSHQDHQVSPYFSQNDASLE